MKVLLRTFGCRANHYDSEAVREMLVAQGHEIVADPRAAEAAVFNSCAVTAEAEADLRKAVRRAARENPSLRTTIMGCASALATNDAASPIHSLPGVERVVAGADLAEVAESMGIVPLAQIRTRSQAGTRAVLRVQDGCDEHCTFCVTTIARGGNRSRPVPDVIEEALLLADRHPEIVLTGVHVGSYGADIGTTLGALVESLVREVPSVRFRLASVEATEVDELLAELLTDSGGRLAPSLHAPLQSGSDRVLKRMGRHWYTAADYARATERLVVRSGVFGLGADIICGFPGETEDDHRATVSLVGGLPFSYLHVFPYSPRPGTAATKLGGVIAPDTVARRASELRELGALKSRQYAASRDGGTADVVALEWNGKGRRRGVSEDYLTVSLEDPSRPRGSRFPATLRRHDGELVACV